MVNYPSKAASLESLREERNATLNNLQLASEEKLRLVLEIDRELNQTQDIDLLLQRILLEARQAVNADAGSIYIKQEQELQLKYAQNDTMATKLGQPIGGSVYVNFSLPINTKTIAGYAAYTGKNVNIRNVYNIPDGAPFSFSSAYDEETGYKTESCLCFPLVTNQNEVIGVLQLINAKSRLDNSICPFQKEDEDFLSHFASLATIALQRAKITRAILMRMIKMAGLRDPKETGAHVNRVGAFSVELYKAWAHQNKVPEAEMGSFADTLRMAAMLHDVGKVGISDTILKKPARFTPEEYKVMQHHSTIGAELFRCYESDLEKMAREIALRHHENWDGTGYPGHVDLDTWEPTKLDADKKVIGLKGEEIPLAARIVALCDVYDALSSIRVYKPSWSHEDVITEIKRCKGTKFDPELVELFLEIIPTIKQIQELYQDD